MQLSNLNMRNINKFLKFEFDIRRTFQQQKQK